MGLDKVVQDILRRGEEKSKEIIRTGEKERDEQVQAAQKKIEVDRKRSEEKANLLIAQMEQQELSSAELESRRALLESEKQIMEELKEQVLEELSEYAPDKRKKIYAKLVTGAKKELGDCVVYANREDARILKLPTGMTLGATIDCRGGLVFESKDKSIRLDYRFETILDDVWSKRMREIYTELFG